MRLVVRRGPLLYDSKLRARRIGLLQHVTLQRASVMSIGCERPSCLSVNAMSLTRKMRAWIYNNPGAPRDVLQLSTTVPEPSTSEAAPIILDVHAVALNPDCSVLMKILPSEAGAS